MRHDPKHLEPEAWIAHLFASKSAQEGRVIRRSLRDIERYAGMDRFLDEVQLRGFRAVENAGQVIVFCNRYPIRKLR